MRRVRRVRGGTDERIAVWYGRGLKWRDDSRGERDERLEGFGMKGQEWGREGREG